MTTENDQARNTQVTKIADYFAKISGVSVIETLCEPGITRNQVAPRVTGPMSAHTVAGHEF